MSGFGLPLLVAGGLIKAGGEASALRDQAAIADENARLSILSGEQQVGQVNRQSRQAMGDSIASMAESGFVTGTGTAADLITASSLNAARDVAALRTKAAYSATSYRNEAAARRKAASNAIIGGLFGAVSTALAGTASSDATAAEGAARQRLNAASLFGRIGG